MSGKHLDELLQQCLTSFDAGMSPEECLSAFPAQRDVLEPLFRQAVSLRVAFAASPRPEFRARTRDRVMFMAGREVNAALASNPDPEFIQDARQRFIRAAGAESQEALRNVPPPRLPFWINARRRLLEAAAASQPQPVPQRGGAFAMRAGLSAAVVVLALALAGVSYMIGFTGGPSGASAELAQLERDLDMIEQQQRAGATISAAALNDLSARTSKLLDQIEQEQGSSAVVEKLPDLIDRQKTVVMAAANQGLLAPETAQAQTQQLEQAEKTVEEIRNAAAPAPTSTAPAGAASTVTAAPSTPAATSAASVTPEAATTPAPLGEGEVRVSALIEDTFGNQPWKRIDTANLSISVPASWVFVNVLLDGDNDGVGEFEGERLLLNGPNGLGIVVNVSTGQITATLTTTEGTTRTLNLRSGGLNGALISIEELTTWATPELAGDFRHLIETLELHGALETPTPAPANTATPEATATPPVTTTPAPSATP